jgi:hypothetical protein
MDKRETQRVAFLTYITSITYLTYITERSPHD